jgi:hypothetical protein
LPDNPAASPTPLTAFHAAPEVIDFSWATVSVLSNASKTSRLTCGNLWQPSWMDNWAFSADGVEVPNMGVDLNEQSRPQVPLCHPAGVVVPLEDASFGVGEQLATMTEQSTSADATVLR